MDYNQFIRKFRESQKDEHKLIIKSLYDAQLECSCGHFSYKYTGEITREQAQEIFEKEHLKDFSNKT